MRTRKLVPHTIVAGALLLAAGFLAVPVLSVAQDAASSPTGVGGLQPHPAHIHNGTCENLGEIVYPLQDLEHEEFAGTPGAMEASPTPLGANLVPEMGEIESQSITTVDAALEELLSSDHAINVHKSAEEIDMYIACGEITGQVEGGQLQVELKERNTSGIKGWAILLSNPDDTTTVVTMVQRIDESTMGTPVATPAA